MVITSCTPLLLTILHDDSEKTQTSFLTVPLLPLFPPSEEGGNTTYEKKNVSESFFFKCILYIPESSFYNISHIEVLKSEDIIGILKILFQKTFYGIYFMNFRNLIPKTLFWKPDFGNLFNKFYFKNSEKPVPEIFQNIYSRNLFFEDKMIIFKNLWEWRKKL